MTLLALQQQGWRAPKALLPLLRDLGNIKRIRSAGSIGSISERIFADAWWRIANGENTAETARGTTLEALIATRLGDLSPTVLQSAGIPQIEVQHIRRRAAEDATAVLEPALRDWLLESAPKPICQAPPAFVTRLAAQPRAGATCQGRGRLMLEPPESHADHCALVAVYGVLLASAWNAKPETVFLAAMAHHLHNALLPDSGFVGEELLGSWLEPAMSNATASALDELAEGPRHTVETARQILPDVASSEGRAFHAADTLDRVLQVEHHLNAAGTTMAYALNEMQLVHAGPVKPFQDAVLLQMGLAA